jgi:hypothetical protein
LSAAGAPGSVVKKGTPSVSGGHLVPPLASIVEETGIGHGCPLLPLRLRCRCICLVLRPPSRANVSDVAIMSPFARHDAVSDERGDVVVAGAGNVGVDVVVELVQELAG